MSKGFVIFAKNTQTVDYVRQACALALSIKTSQTEIKNISIVTNDSVPTEFLPLFDNVIPIPWFTEEGSVLAAEHRWKIYHATPYDETIVLDSDMLVFKDLSVWWKYLENYDLHFCSTIKNYKDDIVLEDPVHRKAFIANKLPNVYYALHYFKKTDQSLAFYKVLEFVIKNWELCYGKFAPEEYQSWVSMDLSAAIALKICAMEDEVITPHSPLEFVHMKPAIQGWVMDNAKWQNAVHKFMNKSADLFIANIKQNTIFHYVEKDFLNDEIFQILEENYNGR